MSVLATIEVVRPTATSPLTTAADLAAVGVLAMLATLLALLLLESMGRPVSGELVSRARSAAVGAAVVAPVLRVAAAVDAGAGIGATLGTRRVLAQLAALVVVALLALVAHPRAGLQHAERRAAEALLGLLGIAAVVLAGPRSGGASALAPAVAAAAGALVVALLATMLLPRLQLRSAGGRVLALAVAAAAIGWPAAILPSGYTSFSDELRVDGQVLLLTVAPAVAGANEVHLYVLDDQGRQQDVENATLTVDGRPPVALLKAGPGHLLTFGLLLPQGDAWPVTIEADTRATGTLTATTEVTADG